MRRRLAAAILAVCALAALGCGAARPDAAPAALAPVAAIRALHGATPALRARLALRLVESGGEARTVDLHLWLAADGRLRAKITRLDVDALDLRLEADGAFLAWAPRTALVARGRLDQADVPPLLARLRQLADELASGPLPAGAAPVAGADGAWTWREGDLLVRLRTDVDGRALSKLVQPAAGGGDGDAVRLDYDRYRGHDGLQRAGRVRIAAPGLDLTAVLREFNPVDAISPDGLRVTPGPAARAVAISDLLEHLE